MKKPFVYLLTTLTCLSSQYDALARIRRVTTTGGSTTSGISWVDASAYGNLQTAISASAIGDTVWVKAGTYQPAAGASFRMKEGVVILGGFNGTETVVTDRNWAANTTILNGNEATVVLNTFTAGSPLSGSSVLDGFTITNGKSSSYSGGIHNEYASPVINNCRVLNDTTWKTGQGYGGGIGNINSSPVVSNTVLKQCYAEYSGGGLSNSYSSGVFSNLIIDSNAAVFYGGGICNWSTGTPVFENMVVCNNIAIGTGSGAGMANIYSDAEPTVNNTVFINNTTGTSTSYGGGGFWNYEGTASLANVTFVGNSADRGGALRVTNGATINIVNAVFWNNSASVAGNDMDILGGSSINTTYSYTQSAAAGTGNILGTASPFVDVTNPKGPDGTWMTEDDGLRPLYSSLIRDAGTGTGAPATDILGKPRPGGAGFDMGAYESSLRLYVKADAAGANNGSNWANAFTNLQQAIDSSKAGGEIWIAAGTYKPSKDAFGSISPADNRDKAFYIRDSVSLYGGFNGTENNLSGRAGLFTATVLSGDLDNTPAVYTDDVYHVVLSINSSAATLLDGLTFEKGNADGHTAITVSGYNISRGKGAGMYLANAPMTIRNVTIRDNKADFGAGIYNEESDAILDHVLFLRNIADTQAGAMLNSNGAPLITASVFDANSSGGDGGAMSNNGGSTITMTLNNVIFRSNSAAGHAGAMDNNMNAIVRNSVFSNNEAVAGHGGAIAQHSDKLTAVNNIFWGNTAGDSDADLYVDLTISTVAYSYAQVAISGTGNTTGSGDPFLDNAYPKGPDSLWLTADDGLQLPFCSDLVNIGDNMGVSATDILGRPRISGTTVDLGAYEKQSYPADFKKNARLSNNTANALPFIPICDEGEWTYYADPTMPDSLSFAIAWGAPNAAAKATAEMRLTVAPTLTAATTTTDGIWTMRRYWNVNLGADTLSTPVKVRFYYNPADTVAMRAAANSWNTTYGIGLDAISPVRWFKTISVPFTPSLVTPTDINAGNKKLLRPVYGSSNGVAYVQFDTVTSFSGGTAAIGAKLGALALPLELVTYTAQYADNGASVLSSWTVGEESAVRYDVQRSTDAQHFETVGRVTAAKNHTYTYTDQLPASVKGQQLYYRLAIIDADNSLSYSGVVRLSAGNASDAMLRIAPNPVSGSFTIINTDAALNGQEAVITDLLGTVISRVTIAPELSVSTQSWLPGVYILRLADATVYRIVKQ